MAKLQGKIAWNAFLRAYLLALLLPVCSLGASLTALQAGFRGRFIAAGLALLAALGGLTHFVRFLAGIVTRFEMQDDQLTLARLGRGRRTVSWSDVAEVSPVHPHERFARVTLRNGAVFVLLYDHLACARELARVLRAATAPKPAPPIDAAAAGQPLETLARRGAVAGALLQHGALCVVLLGVAVAGGACFALAAHPLQVQHRGAFVGLGCLLPGLAAAGIYFGVWRYWKGAVRWCRLAAPTFEYRTFWGRSVVQRSLAEVTDVSTRRPATQRGEDALWYRVQFRDGDACKLQAGLLGQAHALAAALRAAVQRRASDDRPPLQRAQVELHPTVVEVLAEGEQVYWLGRPVCGKLWNDIAALVGLGFLPGGLGAFVLTIGGMLLGQGQQSGWALIAAGGAFFAQGLYLWATPWRYRRMLHETIYAVTSHRALSLHGLEWGEHCGLRSAAEPLVCWTAAQVRCLEISANGRDLVMSGRWVRSGKGRQSWVCQGFLAPDDVSGAEAALRRFIADFPSDRPH